MSAAASARRRPPMRRLVVSMVGALVLLTGCAFGYPMAPPPPGQQPPGSSISPSLTASIAGRLEELPGVDAVESYDALIVVTVSADAPDDVVVALANAADAIARDRGADLTIDLVRAGAGYDAELDMPIEDPWRVTAYPASDVEELLTGVLQVEKLTGVTSTVVTGGWASVRIDPTADFGETFGTIAETFPFSEGATYTEGSGEHLMIVHVPERTTVDAVRTIADIAADYPTAEFLLQSPTEGPRWPQLLVAHLDAAQGAALDARLREPDLADADPEGLPQRFQLTVVGSSGPTYVAGTLGDVPR